jgi:hypothetical protein
MIVLCKIFVNDQIVCIKFTPLKNYPHSAFNSSSKLQLTFWFQIFTSINTILQSMKIT